MMEDSMTPTDEIRGSAPAMTTKDLLLEVYRDMKFVRPAVEGLLAAGVVSRIEAIEREELAAKAAGLNANLVARVEVLEKDHESDASKALERRRIGDLSARTLATVIVVSNFIVGLVVVVANLAA